MEAWLKAIGLDHRREIGSLAASDCVPPKEWKQAVRWIWTHRCEKLLKMRVVRFDGVGRTERVGRHWIMFPKKEAEVGEEGGYGSDCSARA